MPMRLDAYEAVKERKVTLDVKSVDSYKRAKVDVINHTNDDIELDFSRTVFLPAGESDAQRLGLSYVSSDVQGTYILTIPGSSQGSKEFEARCLDYHRPAPPNGLTYIPIFVPAPAMIAEMLRRGVSQEDIWFDIENTPALLAEWISLDPRGTTINPGSIPLSQIIPLRQRSKSGSELSIGSIIGSWEGAHPVRDGSVLEISRANDGDYKFKGIYIVVGHSLAGALFTVGEDAIWLNSTSVPGEYQGKIKRRQSGSGDENYHDVFVVMTNEISMTATDIYGSFEYTRV